ncbi:hypothetical protein HZH66_005685 [Vespula vulgaris]|uniref:Uncharacterized protein n=1 Tax=Vespula vulgaris TaxID=7454 RepID=A0A834KAU2_VESVU|nr:hypothetical protein HZH66_005685 [Vespula vulgaris]
MKLEFSGLTGLRCRWKESVPRRGCAIERLGSEYGGVNRVETVGQYGGGVVRKAEEWDGMGLEGGER